MYRTQSAIADGAAVKYSPTRMYAGNAQKKNMNIAGRVNDLLFLFIPLKSAKTSAPCT